MTYSFDTSFKVVEVLIQSIAVQLNTRQLVNRTCSDTESFLKALEHSFPISIRSLRREGSSNSSAREEEEFERDVPAHLVVLTDFSSRNFRLPP